MDGKIRSIEKLLFVLLKRHTAFNGQFNVGVVRRFCGREFAPSGDKPPPAWSYANRRLDAPVLQAADFVPDYKVGRLFFRRPGYRSRAPPPPLCFRKNKSEVQKIAGLSQK